MLVRVPSLLLGLDLTWTVDEPAPLRHVPSLGWCSCVDAVDSDALNQVLVGKPLSDAVDRLRQTGWAVRTDDLDDPTETFTADLRVGRATVQHRNDLVIAITIG